MLRWSALNQSGQDGGDACSEVPVMTVNALPVSYPHPFYCFSKEFKGKPGEWWEKISLTLRRTSVPAMSSGVNTLNQTKLKRGQEKRSK